MASDFNKKTDKLNIQTAIERVARMEELFNQLSCAFEAEPECLKTDVELQNAAKLLSDYLSNGEWLQDHDLDEQRLLPNELKRGVLSEDGLYNLLCDIKD